MRAVFLQQSDKTLVHTTEDCHQQRKQTFRFGMYVGAIIGISLCLGLGIGLSRWQEAHFDSQLRMVQAQHRAELEYEKKRVARYAEIDALATEMDRVAAMGESRWTYRDRERGE